MKQKHNALCPICKDTWHFNPSEAKLTDEERLDLNTHGNLHVICENCDEYPFKIDKVATELEKQGRVLSHW